MKCLLCGEDGLVLCRHANEVADIISVLKDFENWVEFI